MIFASCSPLIQKAYFANPPNVNCFQSEKEKNLKLSQGLNHFEIQSNIAFNKNIGLSTGLYGGFRGQYGAEIAGIFYNKFNDKNYFETQVGYGYFNNKSKVAGQETFFVMPMHNINTTYHKIFIQPTYFITTKRINFGIAIKLNAVYYDKYHYYYKKLTDVSDADHTFKTYISSTADYRNKWNIVYEPVITVQFRDIYIQFSGIFSNNNFYSTKYEEVYRLHEYNDTWEYLLVSKKEVGLTRLPQHVHLLFTVGHKFTYKKKK